MRKSLIIAGIAVAVLVTGCQDAVGPGVPNNAGGANNGSYNDFEKVGAPKWVLSPIIEGGCAGVGSAMPRAGMGLGWQRTQAEARGREALAKQLSVEVKGLFQDFTQTTGTDESGTVDQLVKNAMKQVTNQTLAGSKPKDAWVAPSGELHVLMVLDPSSVKAAVKDAVKTSFKNEAAEWQKFQAKKGMDELDAEIEKQIK